jgi:hypothetical protein
MQLAEVEVMYHRLPRLIQAPMTPRPDRDFRDSGKRMESAESHEGAQGLLGGFWVVPRLVKCYEKTYQRARSQAGDVTSPLVFFNC